MKFKIVSKKEDLKIGKHYILLNSIYNELLVKELSVILCLSNITGNDENLCFKGKYLCYNTLIYSKEYLLFLSDLEISLYECNNHNNKLIEIIDVDFFKAYNELRYLDVLSFKKIIKRKKIN